MSDDKQGDVVLANVRKHPVPVEIDMAGVDNVGDAERSVRVRWNAFGEGTTGKSIEESLREEVPEPGMMNGVVSPLFNCWERTVLRVRTDRRRVGPRRDHVHPDVGGGERAEDTVVEQAVVALDDVRMIHGARE